MWWLNSKPIEHFHKVQLTHTHTRKTKTLFIINIRNKRQSNCQMLKWNTHTQKHTKWTEKIHLNWPTSNEGCFNDHFDDVFQRVWFLCNLFCFCLFFRRFDVDSNSSSISRSAAAAQIQFHAPHRSNTCTLLLSFSTFFSFLEYCSPSHHSTLLHSPVSHIVFIIVITIL